MWDGPATRQELTFARASFLSATTIVKTRTTSYVKVIYGQRLARVIISLFQRQDFHSIEPGVLGTMGACLSCTTASPEARRSPPGQTGEPDSVPPKQTAKIDESAADPIPVVAAARPPKPFLLPIELLIDVFLYLSTSDVIRAALVCRAWRNATLDVRIWRHLSFSEKVQPAKVFGAAPVQFTPLKLDLRGLGAKCGNAVETVDFTTLEWDTLSSLAYGLMASTSTVRHVRWVSTGEERLECLRAVSFLSHHCPHLETLELRAQGACVLADLLVEAPSVAKARYFSLTTASFWFMLVSPDVQDDQVLPFDHATTLEFRLTSYPLRGNGWLSIHTFNRILKIPAVEKLTVHGLWDGGHLTHRSIEAPSLTYLDIRWSNLHQSQLVTLNAPNLTELAIDARLLPIFTPSSLSALPSLTLRVDGQRSGDQLYPQELDKVKHHQGVLKLYVAHLYAEEVLTLLSESFFWPGLEEIEMELTHKTSRLLIGVMAARIAGVRGATKEEYLDWINYASDQFSWCNGLVQNPEDTPRWRQVATEILARAALVQPIPPMPPLCKPVWWKLSRTQYVWTSTTDLLKQQPNVDDDIGWATIT